jgi:hypothetical protein
LQAFVDRWGAKMMSDPFYNPNLAIDAIDYRIGQA